MSLAEKVRELAHKAGLTKDVEFRESGEMCAEAVVKKKKWFPGVAWMQPNFLVTFQAYREELEMQVPECLYDRMKEEQKVLLSYTRVYRYEYDYVPPDFGQKELISTKCVDYGFLEAELLEDEKPISEKV